MKRFRITARSIMTLRIHTEWYEHDDLETVITQVSILFWVPFTPIFFVLKRPFSGRPGNEIICGIVDYWKSPKSFFTKISFGLYRVHHGEMYKKRRRTSMPISRGKTTTLIFMHEENGMPIDSPRAAALRRLNRRGYISKEAVLRDVVGMW